MVLLFGRKYQRNYFWISALNFFVASWGLPGDLVYNIISKEAYRKPQKASNTVVQEAMHTAYTRVWNKWVICLKMKKKSTYMHLFAWCLSFSTKIPIYTGCKSQFRKIFEFKKWKEPMLVLKQTIRQQKALDLSFNLAP